MCDKPKIWDVYKQSEDENVNKNYNEGKEGMVVYVLKCENDKYYVGKTYNLNKRYDTHLSGYGAFWTRLYKPIEIVEKIYTSDKYDEDKYVWKYMEKYGIENVRGGSYTEILMPDSSIACATRHIKSACDICYSCGQKGHMIRDCPIQSKKRKLDDVDESEEMKRKKQKTKNKDDYNNFNKINEKFKSNLNAKCTRCKRFGHYYLQCYAKTMRDGSFIGYN